MDSVSASVQTQNTELARMGQDTINSFRTIDAAIQSSQLSHQSTLDALSRRSDEMMLRFSECQANVFQLIADLQQEQTRLRLTILDLQHHARPRNSSAVPSISSLPFPQEIPLGPFEGLCTHVDYQSQLRGGDQVPEMLPGRFERKNDVVNSVPYNSTLVNSIQLNSIQFNFSPVELNSLVGIILS